TERRRHEDTTRVVDLTLDRTRDVDALQLLYGAVELRQLRQALFEGRPLGRRVRDEAGVERARQDDAALADRREHVTVAGGEARAPLRIDRVLVATAKHRRR